MLQPVIGSSSDETTTKYAREYGILRHYWILRFDEFVRFYVCILIFTNTATTHGGTVIHRFFEVICVVREGPFSL